MIWAADESGIPRLSHGQQLVSAVPADVGEGANGLPVPCHDGRLVSNLDSPDLAGPHQVVDPADTEPGAVEEPIVFPQKHVG